MENIMIQKLHAYMLENHPELVVRLQDQNELTSFLNNKISIIRPQLDQLIQAETPGYIIEEQCLRELIRELGPSRFNYVKMVLETEFPKDYERLLEAGIMTYETINILEQCREIFDSETFVSGEDNRYLRYHIISIVSGYFS